MARPLAELRVYLAHEPVLRVPEVDAELAALCHVVVVGLNDGTLTFEDRIPLPSGREAQVRNIVNVMKLGDFVEKPDCRGIPAERAQGVDWSAQGVPTSGAG
jgi:hypothetical protein